MEACLSQLRRPMLKSQNIVECRMGICGNSTNGDILFGLSTSLEYSAESVFEFAQHQLGGELLDTIRNLIMVKFSVASGVSFWRGMSSTHASSYHSP
jgi:hypothetical protein